MNAKDFVEMLDRYGADLAVWPVALRDAAQALIATDAALAAELALAAKIEAELLALPERSPDAALLGRLLMVPARSPRPSLVALWQWLSPFGRWGSVATMLGALVMGVWLGAVQPVDAGDPLTAMMVEEAL